MLFIDGMVGLSIACVFCLGGEKVRITIKLVGDVAVGDYHRLQVFNIILRKCMNTLRLQLVGRNFFDAVAKVCMYI